MHAPNQVPTCVLAALHEHRSLARLHVRTFSIRSLYQEARELNGIDPDELILITSPCLYGICVGYTGHENEIFDEFMKHLRTRYATRLKRVQITM